MTTLGGAMHSHVIIEGLNFNTLAPSTLAGVCVLLILTGRLVPRRTYDDIVHDRDEWRAAHRISESARVLGEDHQRDMAETARTMNQVMREMQDRLGGANDDHTGGSPKEAKP